ncbi:RNA-binding protein 5 [Aspergillus tubingensis]|nr:RNA-binding protein 5 [Aspergillus tubingensis]
MSHFHPDEARYPPGPSHRPMPRRDDRDGRMYDDRSPSRSRSPGETESTPDPVTAVGIAMTFDGARRAPLLRGEEDQPTGIATVRAIALRDTIVGAEATVAAAAAVLAATDNRITDMKAER